MSEPTPAVLPMPCPFCGKPGSIDEERSRARHEHVVFVPSCSDSDCVGVLIQSFARRSEAIAAWNTRANRAPAGSGDARDWRIEAAREFLDAFDADEHDGARVDRAIEQLRRSFAAHPRPQPAADVRTEFEAAFSAIDPRWKPAVLAAMRRGDDYCDAPTLTVCWKLWQAASAATRRPAGLTEEAIETAVNEIGALWSRSNSIEHRGCFTSTNVLAIIRKLLGEKR